MVTAWRRCAAAAGGNSKKKVMAATLVRGMAWRAAGGLGRYAGLDEARTISSRAGWPSASPPRFSSFSTSSSPTQACRHPEPIST